MPCGGHSSSSVARLPSVRTRVEARVTIETCVTDVAPENRKPQACLDVVGSSAPVEPLEHVGHILRRNPDAPVDDFDHDRKKAGDEGTIRLIYFAPSRARPDFTKACTSPSPDAGHFTPPAHFQARGSFCRQTVRSAGTKRKDGGVEGWTPTLHSERGHLLGGSRACRKPLRAPDRATSTTHGSWGSSTGSDTKSLPCPRIAKQPTDSSN